MIDAELAQEGNCTLLFVDGDAKQAIKDRVPQLRDHLRDIQRQFGTAPSTTQRVITHFIRNALAPIFCADHIMDDAIEETCNTAANLALLLPYLQEASPELLEKVASYIQDTHKSIAIIVEDLTLQTCHNKPTYAM